MFKQKYLGFLVIGLALGIGLFGFISYFVKNDPALIYETQTKESTNKTKNNIQDTSDEALTLKYDTEVFHNEKPKGIIDESPILGDLEFQIIKPEEMNSFQLLLAMQAEAYSPNKDDWSYDTENYLTTFLADNPLSPNTETKFVCDQQACLIESIDSSVDFTKVGLGESKEWDDFNNRLQTDESFKQYFHAIERTILISPLPENQQRRIALYLRKPLK